MSLRHWESERGQLWLIKYVPAWMVHSVKWLRSRTCNDVSMIIFYSSPEFAISVAGMIQLEENLWLGTGVLFSDRVWVLFDYWLQKLKNKSTVFKRKYCTTFGQTTVGLDSAGPEKGLPERKRTAGNEKNSSLGSKISINAHCTVGADRWRHCHGKGYVSTKLSMLWRVAGNCVYTESGC